MAFAVPKSKQSIKQNRFEFTLPDDPQTKYSLPLLKFVRPALMAQADTINEFALRKLLLDEYAPGAFDKFEDGSQMDALMEAWQEASGIDVGESSASSS